mgnify:CR=1 FL=1
MQNVKYSYLTRQTSLIKIIFDLSFLDFLLFLHSITQKTFYKTVALCCLFTLTACSSLGGGSLEKRSMKLASGIQKAYSVDPTTAQRVSPLIIQHSEKYQIDPLLMAALIRQESTYRSNAVSSSGAVGLTQVLPRYWQKICGDQLFDENINIHCGSYILGQYFQSAQNWKKALAYYNVGPTGYESSWKNKRQGKKYAKSVKQHQKNLKNAL